MESLKLTSDVQSLVSEDILTRQAELCRILALFCHFTGHTLFFPRSLEQTKPQLLSREHKLMLPLLWHGQALGVLVLNGVKSKEIRVLLPFLPSMVELALENLALTKANGLDAQTGLCVEEQLYARMLEEARAVRGPEMAKTDLSKVPAYRLCMGLVVLRFSNGEELAARCGWTFFLDLLKKIAKTLKDSLPSEVLIARLGHFDFGLLFHSHGREKCQQLAKTALSALAGLEVSSPLTKQAVYPVFTAGFTFYPNDMRERELLLSMEEQSHLAYRRAKLALEVAAPGHVLGYAEILRQGGRIIELLPLGRYKINLGRMMGVQIGQRFSVFGLGENRAYKGEVIVLQARKKSAVVEVRYQEDPGSLPEAGDVLEYVSEERKESQAAGENSALALPGQKEFYASILNDYPDFALATLVLLHVEGKGEEAGNQALALAKSTWEEFFKTEGEAPARLGRHGQNILACFHGKIAAEDLVANYTAICEKLEQVGISACAGLAGYPLLSYHRSALQDCALKALEYARLLPKPRVGLCNSLALTISADKLYSLGDLFNALEEYKIAVVLDDNNDMAWNSMGVCLAALGQKEEAQKQFLEALKRATEPAQISQILYNLGTVCQSLGDQEQAMDYFKRCVENDTKHLYARLRLGQLYEQLGKRDLARRMYEEGAEIEEGAYSSNFARLHLARIAAKQEDSSEARTILQDALQHNPNDAAALLMLAKIYLEGGEDPEIAESLARKSLSLQERPEGWQVLALALRSQGQEERATQAEARALATGRAI